MNCCVLHVYQSRSSRGISLACSFFIIVSSLFTQNVHPLQHALQISSSDNSALLTGASAVYANPASSSIQEDQWQFALSGNNRFNTDIQNISSALSMKLGGGSLGVLIGRYGISEFNESQVSLSYSKELGKKSFLGIQGHYYQLQIEGIDNVSSGDISLGFWHSFNEKVILSAYLKNPIDGFQNKDRVIGKAEISLAYLVSPKLAIYTAVEKPWSETVSVRPGLRYTPSPQLHLFISSNTSPSSMSFGIGLDLSDHLNTDLGFNSHPVLGSSLSLSLGYRI